jgi:hypothetical protein
MAKPQVTPMLSRKFPVTELQGRSGLRRVARRKLPQHGM